MRPFDGIRVLDLTHVLAGPFATYQLAVLGADVIKIEAPHRPDMTRADGVVPELGAQGTGTYFMAQNAGKRAIALDLASPEGKAAMRRLIAGADVLVQNYSGDSLGDLGFGPEEALAINPRLVYCQMTGFGRTGPKAEHPAYDCVIQAFSGIMAANGTPETGPVRVGPPMVDYGTGAQAALAISAALYQRDRTDKGQVIDVAMLDAALMLMSAVASDAAVSGEAPGRHGNRHKSNAGYSAYETADGLLMIGAWTNAQYAALLDALGAPEAAAEVRATPREDLATLRPRHEALIERIVATASADHWEAHLNAAHVPAARVRTVNEALAHPQVASRRVMQPSGLSSPGPEKLPVAAFHYAHGGPAITRPPPRQGEHTAEVLAEFGFSPEEIAGLAPKPGSLPLRAAE